MSARTLYDKLWDSHCVHTDADGNSLVYIDRHFVIEVTSAQAYEGLRLAGRKAWRADSIVATADHNTPTTDWDAGISDPVSQLQVDTLDANVKQFGAAHYYPFRDASQGIAHVIGPELGATLPGMTIGCGDSHTTTHGALGTLAFGIGTSEVESVLATQCLVMQKHKAMQVKIDGALHAGVTSKDLALALIGKIGTAGGSGHVVEFSGATVAAMSMEARMTLCNMSIEAGARAGMVAVDDSTIDYVRVRPLAPKGKMWERAAADWRDLHSDSGARFDLDVELRADTVAPQVTWGTSPEFVAAIDQAVPDPAAERDPVRRAWMEHALRYMGLAANTPIASIAIDKVFIGSCTNSRIEDLRVAAGIVRGRRVAGNVKRALVVPGSGRVKRQAEDEGLDRIFIAAGFEWRQPGCSMCVGINADRLSAGERCASTSNRNFEGRQGPGGRTHLVSPGMAAAAAIAGHFVDVRELM